ncbi:MAG: peptide chain release factor 1 [Omnitrophica bacterium RIFCSPLOWO2_01_FULL_45_10]|nr:MAG: peptide chain release factor 1 [Omnitrophica bacterium RIFCSPLOWO2_01_FULL_45_10]
MLDKIIEKKKKRFEELQVSLADPKVIANPVEYRSLAKELAGLTPLINKYNEYLKISNDLKDMDRVLAEKSQDAEFLLLAEEEKRNLEFKIKDVESRLEEILLDEEAGISRNIIMEIRAGTGGLEASLFAADLLRMYSKYAQKKGWKVELIASSITEKGGYKEVIISISGKGAYERLKYESGTHRVQRVPITEASGRIHTSAATVAVLPEAEDVEIDIKPDDLRIDVFRASGKGGQGVNRTDSAVRITHIPTGMVVTCQDERSQLKNKAKALRVLRARLFDAKKDEQESKMSRARRIQVGTGDRSEKIRTYNFPDRRLTDHRIGLAVHNLEEVLEGELDDMIQALRREDKRLKLEARAG